jgi:ferredoxin
MLDFVAAERRETSRLACQVHITAQHNGLRIHLPARQI